MASDPRIHKPRSPKIYTDQQLVFLRSNLPEFEQRLLGSIRGDAKKFALEKASDFIAQFGLPDEFVDAEESESRFKEQIYNWFKNTVGRARRKLGGRPRQDKKTPEKTPDDHGWPNNATVTTPSGNPFSPVDNDSPHTTGGSPQSTIPSVQFGNIHTSINTPVSLPPMHQNTLQSHPLALPVTHSTLRDAFTRGINAANLSSMIQAFVMANPSVTPLNPVIAALYEAIFSNSFQQDPAPYVRRYLAAADLFTHSLVHAGSTGPQAGLRALEMLIRKNSIWVPSTNPYVTPASPLSVNSNSLADEMRRVASERQRRRDHVQWARVHAATLELCVLMASQRATPDATCLTSKIFSDIVARDAVWGSDEVEWVAGICILKAIIRTATGTGRQQRDNYNELLHAYENRWKEIRDDARQTLATEVLLAAKEDLARWDEILG